jgi:hypothetical protein
MRKFILIFLLAIFATLVNGMLLALTPEAKKTIENLREKYKNESVAKKNQFPNLNGKTIKSVFEEIHTRPSKVIIPKIEKLDPDIKPELTSPKPAKASVIASKPASLAAEETNTFKAEAYENGQYKNSASDFRAATSLKTETEKPFQWNKLFLIIFLICVLVFLLLFLTSLIANKDNHPTPVIASFEEASEDFVGLMFVSLKVMELLTTVFAIILEGLAQIISAFAPLFKGAFFFLIIFFIIALAIPNFLPIAGLILLLNIFGVGKR